MKACSWSHSPKFWLESLFFLSVPWLFSVLCEVQFRRGIWILRLRCIFHSHASWCQFWCLAMFRLLATKNHKTFLRLTRENVFLNYFWFNTNFVIFNKEKQAIDKFPLWSFAVNLSILWDTLLYSKADLWNLLAELATPIIKLPSIWRQ